MRVSHDTYQLVFGIAYLGLMTNAMLTIACLPLIALLALTDPAQTWPLIAAFAPLVLMSGIGVVAALVVLSVNLQVRAVGELSALTVPLLGVLAVLVVATCLTGLVAVAEAPDASLREIVTVSAVLGLRRWYLTAVSLVVLGSLAGFFFVKPALAIGLAAAPLLYVVWAGGRHTLKPAIVEELS